ncbi:hypothetical protein [Nocardiopsis alborubida]|uniref:Uncharacterized protein n=1 Tax=Nocardiopsis alborubida TaxID=146802 RepID=A0A7X6MIB4_9ACTN|nr:hypothetical protein [Nocardiopsis alborubida]NKZ01045.1 hypothetical protein [Nocardiopsis alborubida]
MVNKRMKARVLLALVRRMARKNGLRPEEPKGRGKGTHQTCVLLDEGGAQVGRFVVTQHSKELSRGLLRDVEDGLQHLFGEKWMEK